VVQVVIENPVINSPFEEPKLHFRFSKDGITDEKVESRRISSYFVPIPPPKKKGKSAQLAFDTEWTQDREQENTFINRVRERVSLWRKGGYVGITRTTRRLLDYWQNPQREKKLFFCQIEALETAIYLTEVAGKYSDSWIENSIRDENERANPLLYRIAFKMATGSGKTVVMAMLIAWHVLNKQANPQDARFTDAFLIVTPGITIKDRLRVLYPNDLNNYYQARDILPQDLMADLNKVKLIITNFHAFKPRELVKAGRLTKNILGSKDSGALTETPDQMVRRVCRELGSKKNIVVINDEAHHCYRRKQEAEDDKLSGDERKEAEKREEEARVWISGLEAVKNKIGIKAIYDLSATPFFLRGSGYREGTLFPWVVSDFSLIDAIESGIVKVPRVPVADDSMRGDLPTYRNIWVYIRDHLPKKGRRTEKSLGSERKLPKELEGALHSLYGNYEKYYRLWEQNAEARASGLTPPVFIVVCNNTQVSKLVYDYISGWDKQLPDTKKVVVSGQLPIFRNHDDYGNWLPSPNTILIDSTQLESGEAMSREFKKIAALAIEEFKHEYRIRFGRDVEKLTDEDLLREVMNTVGKPGKLGENIKCVVSVSMLTEGWDANTVTHIMGVRAFGTQLLCEQVVGRGLRRTSYVTNDNGLFDPEYAEIYGVPFSFIPCAGSQSTPRQGPTPTRVRALEERLECEITFPRVEGYRYDFPEESLQSRFTDDSIMPLSTYDIPTKTELAPIIGEATIHDLYALKTHREQEVVFQIAKLVLERYFRDDQGNVKQWLFPQLLHITRDWMRKCIKLKDNAFIQMLLLKEESHAAAEKIYQSIVTAEPGPGYLKPILRQYDKLGSTRYVDFTTTRPTYPTRSDKCHISRVVADTESWEQKTAQAIEEMDEVVCYVKNQGLNFTIPYALEGEERNYMPDFIVRIRTKDNDILNLILETSGEPRKDKAAKVAAARNLWVPAINNHGGFGKWAFLEITDPWDAKNTIRAYIQNEDLRSS
jgi:type III restriction enzyme